MYVGEKENMDGGGYPSSWVRGPPVNLLFAVGQPVRTFATFIQGRGDPQLFQREQTGGLGYLTHTHTSRIPGVTYHTFYLCHLEIKCRPEVKIRNTI